MIKHMMRHSLFSDCLALISAGSSIAAWQEQLDWGMRILASLIAIIAGTAALIHQYRRRRG